LRGSQLKWKNIYSFNNMVLHSKCPDAENINRQQRPGRTLQRTRCTASALIAHILSGAKLLHTCTHVFRTNALARVPVYLCVLCTSRFTRRQVSPAQAAHPSPPRGQAKRWQAAGRARQQAIFPANCHTCSNGSFLKLTEGCGFHAG